MQPSKSNAYSPNRAQHSLGSDRRGPWASRNASEILSSIVSLLSLLDLTPPHAKYAESKNTRAHIKRSIFRVVPRHHQPLILLATCTAPSSHTHLKTRLLVCPRHRGRVYNTQCRHLLSPNSELNRDLITIVLQSTWTTSQPSITAEKW